MRLFRVYKRMRLGRVLLQVMLCNSSWPELTILDSRFQPAMEAATDGTLSLQGAGSSGLGC